MSNELFQILTGALSLIGGWVLHMFWNEIKNLQASDVKLAEKIGQIEVLVAGDYAKRDEVEKLNSALFKKLDRIEAKLDTKADKP